MTEAPLHPCARCARLQKTCCQRAEILLTLGDLARIEAHTGRDDFWSRRAPSAPEYAEPDESDPNWHRYTFDADGTRRLLKRRAQGDCTFLGERGCVLPLETRPLVCRLYPFAYTESGLDGIDDDYCPTGTLLPKSDPHATMLTVLDMREADGERWRRALYAELKSEHEAAPCVSA